MKEIIEAVLSSPDMRAFIEELVLKIVGEILHRRATDPAFLAHSDASFAALRTAKTEEEKKNALKEIQGIIAGG